MKKINLPKLTFWRAVGFFIAIIGIYAIIERYAKGLGAVTNLSDNFPWGLWIGFDILCGVGLAAGGFTICAVTYVFNIEKFKPLTRSSILTAFLGYLLVIIALLVDLGKPWNIWHAIIMWNPRSVMFEVAWCVMLYTTVLFLEFSPVILERFKLKKTLKVMKNLTILFVIIGVLLSTLHQSSLGSLFLIVPTKMHPLWYSSLLPIYFFLSAVAVGFAMVIMESYLSARAFNKGLELNLLSTCALVSVITLMIYLGVKIIDFAISGKLVYLTQFNQASLLFYLEIIIGVIFPFVLMIQKKLRQSRSWLYIASISIIAGFLLNRLNVSITSITLGTGINYFPSFYEIMITIFLVTAGMWIFGLATKYFPVFTYEEKHEVESVDALKSYELKNEIISK